MLDPKVACFIQLMDIVSALISFIDGTLALKIVFDTELNKASFGE